MWFIISALLVLAMASHRRKLVIVAALCSLSLVIAPPQAQADTDLLTEIATVLSTISNRLATALGKINSTAIGNQRFQQDVLYPLAEINNARGQITSMKATYRNFLHTLMVFNPHTATLPNTQALEVLIRNRQISDLGSLQPAFAAAFRRVPPPTQMSTGDRAMTDMDDAFAQDTLAAAKASDQAQDLLLQAADNIEDQAEISAPGSAPFLTAESVVAQIKSQAVTQKMYAALLREEAGQLAHKNAVLKRGATQSASITNALQRALTHH
jgi:hypothetical protein